MRPSGQQTPPAAPPSGGGAAAAVETDKQAAFKKEFIKSHAGLTSVPVKVHQQQAGHEATCCLSSPSGAVTPAASEVYRCWSWATWRSWICHTMRSRWVVLCTSSLASACELYWGSKGSTRSASSTQHHLAFVLGLAWAACRLSRLESSQTSPS